ncbi:RNA polymerase sigma factor [Winogradskya humida]|uniref:DNA-directed RNA polymerase sigma-70 factor n=1 Tax=Winogradskya humida TaxID=113566 RepID=A0ABQ4A1B9_9ACTN|nr:sigma-70 family RNA polymerase sigma factor [Actinoplanes humidus]GIE24641.1 DNA-directed RNA polymerase sigma-70 factor [Actinoplanes humidus]
MRVSADEQRFRAIHEETYADLLRFVERRIPRADAEDVVASVFLVAWRRLGEVPGDARPWLFGVARRTIANQVRGVRRRDVVDVRMVEDAPAAGADPQAGAGRVDLVRAWWTLSAADREVLSLVAFDGLTGEQAATVLGCRRSTFAMRLGRARRRLRQALEPAVTAPSTPMEAQPWMI